MWPERAFLRRFRAPSSAIARQEAERVLADLILVRGPYAHALCVADGIAEARLARLPPAPVALGAPAQRTGRVRLAGLAAARHGLDTARAAARELGATLVVRIGEGTEPADLARHPGIATDDGPVDAILCPAICETYAPELAEIGLPVIASPMASTDGRGPDRYDVAAVSEALRVATPRALPVCEPLAARLARLSWSVEESRRSPHPPGHEGLQRLERVRLSSVTCRGGSASPARTGARPPRVVRALLDAIERDLDDELGPDVDDVALAADLELERAARSATRASRRSSP